MKQGKTEKNGGEKMSDEQKKRLLLISNVIREKAKQSGLTPRQLAKSSGLSEPCVKRFVTREGVTAHPDTLRKIANVLGIDDGQWKEIVNGIK